MQDRPEIGSLASRYDSWYRRPGAAHWEDAPGKEVLLEALKRCCDRAAPLRLLDIGCGTGSLLERIGSQVSDRWQLHGVDLSAAAVELGNERRAGLHLAQGDATELAATAGSFDVVTCYGSWEHFPDPALAIAEAARVLVPGGWVLAMIPALGIHRDDRDDEGWYEDDELPGELAERPAAARQEQWNLRRETWARMFDEAGVALVDDALARRCGARKPGVFFFGVRLPTATREAPATTPKIQASPSAPATAFAELSRLAARLAVDLAGEIGPAAEAIAERLRRGGKVLACGNGGSAADAQHFVAELVGRLGHERPALPALALTVDPSVMTALANDYGYERVFARQIEALGGPEDVLVAISTSGRSANVVAALRTARSLGLLTLAVLGRDTGSQPAADLALHVPHDDPQRIQEAHTAVLHTLCGELEARLARRKPEP